MKKLYYILGTSLLCLCIIFLRLYGLNHQPNQISLKQSFDQEKVVPIVVIGGGSAGLAAGIYGARTNFYTLVITGKEPGGQLGGTTYVDNMPGMFHQLGPDIMNNMRKQAAECGAQFLDETVKSVEFKQHRNPTTNKIENDILIETHEGSKFHALTLIIATGASPRKLGIPGEEEYWGHGVTTCAICDAAFHKGNDVIVIGGGDSAAEEAKQLAPHAKTVTICVRKDAMRASGAMQKQINNISNISIMYNTEVKEILGDDEKVTQVALFNNKTNTTSSKNVSGVFLAIGHEPNTDLFEPTLKTDQNHYLILKGRTQETSWPGVFAAGDVADPIYKQAVIAAGEGAKAAIEARNYLDEEGFNDAKARELASNYFVPPSADRSLIRELHKVDSSKEFYEFVQGDTPLVVDFYTDYCPSCLQMLPLVEQVASEYGDKLTVVKCDASVLEDIASKYNVKTVPALIAFKDGKEISRSQKALNKQEINDFFATVII